MTENNHETLQGQTIINGESLNDFPHRVECYNPKSAFELRYLVEKAHAAFIDDEDDTLLIVEGGEYGDDREFELQCEKCHVTAYFHGDDPNLSYI